MNLHIDLPVVKVFRFYENKNFSFTFFREKLSVRTGSLTELFTILLLGNNVGFKRPHAHKVSVYNY